jgi:SAM-dependent methyltransferase
MIDGDEYATPDAGSARGFVLERNGRYRIDRRQKCYSIIPNEIILQEMIWFLDEHYGATKGGRMLDVGAGFKPYSVVYSKYFEQCVSVDVPDQHYRAPVDYHAPAHDMPFEDESFDCLICTEVLEHVPDPFAVLRELFRILKPGGRVFLTTPFMVPLHMAPWDFFRYTPFALTKLSEDIGFAVDSVKPRGDYMAVSLGMLQYPVAKFWGLMSKVMRINLNNSSNPINYLTVVLPQLAYLRYWKKARLDTKRSFVSKVYGRLNYITLGYITRLSKP